MSIATMRGFGRIFAIGALLLVGSIPACRAQTANTTDSLGYATPKAAATAYDSAKRDAASQGKRILVVAGGDWCRWCHVLDRFLREHRETNERLRASFVVVKLEVGENGLGAETLRNLPMAVGYPHFWVLSSDGAVVASVDTSSLERGDNDYDTRAFLRFLDTYAPPAEPKR